MACAHHPRAHARGHYARGPRAGRRARQRDPRERCLHRRERRARGKGGARGPGTSRRRLRDPRQRDRRRHGGLSPLRDRRRAHRAQLQHRPVRALSPQGLPLGRRAHRQFRRGEELRARRRLEGEPSRVRRGRARRRARQHRRRHHRRQLRRRQQAPHPHRRRRAHRLEQRAGRPHHGRRGRHHCRGLDGDARGARGRAHRRARAAGDRRGMAAANQEPGEKQRLGSTPLHGARFAARRPG